MFHPFFVFIDMAIKKACLISGGGAWGAYGGGTLERINGDYDTVIGVSTGSLLASHTALKEWEYLKTAYITADNSDVYDGCWYKGKPFTKKGRIRKLPVLVTLLLGQKTIYTSNILRKTFFLVRSFNSSLSLSTSTPFLPITTPGLAVWIFTVT